MMYARVMHYSDNNPDTRTYWFKVPKEYESSDILKVGCGVRCKTKKGYCTGYVQEITTDISKLNVKPFRYIVGVWGVININEINIPDIFKRHSPKQKKIDRCRDEYNLTGENGTVVKFSLDGDLLDGYTMYLVAK